MACVGVSSYKKNFFKTKKDEDKINFRAIFSREITDLGLEKSWK